MDPIPWRKLFYQLGLVIRAKQVHSYVNGHLLPSESKCRNRFRPELVFSYISIDCNVRIIYLNYHILFIFLLAIRFFLVVIRRLRSKRMFTLEHFIGISVTHFFPQLPSCVRSPSHRFVCRHYDNLYE